MEVENNNGRMTLEGRLALITGGGRGIGEATTELFLQEGAHVVIGDIDPETGKAAVERFNEAGYEHVYFEQVDVADPDSVAQAVGNTAMRLGGITTLIANAGITADRSIAKMEFAEWNRVVAVNLTGVWNCCKAVLPHMIEAGQGQIVVASSVARDGNFGQTNYAATKAGVVGLMDSLAIEVGGKNIRVNAVAPGFITSEMTAKMPPKVLEDIVKKIPLKRAGTVKNIADAYRWLVSDEAEYVTRTVIEVDGGFKRLGN